MSKDIIDIINDKPVEFEPHAEISTEAFRPVMDRVDEFSDEVQKGILNLKESSTEEDFHMFNSNVAVINQSGRRMIILVISQRIKTLIEFKMLKNIQQAFNVDFVRVSA